MRLWRFLPSSFAFFASYLFFMGSYAVAASSSDFVRELLSKESEYECSSGSGTLCFFYISIAAGFANSSSSGVISTGFNINPHLNNSLFKGTPNAFNVGLGNIYITGKNAIGYGFLVGTNTVKGKSVNYDGLFYDATVTQNITYGMIDINISHFLTPFLGVGINGGIGGNIFKPIELNLIYDNVGTGLMRTSSAFLQIGGQVSFRFLSFNILEFCYSFSYGINPLANIYGSGNNSRFYITTSDIGLTYEYDKARYRYMAQQVFIRYKRLF